MPFNVRGSNASTVRTTQTPTGKESPATQTDTKWLAILTFCHFVGEARDLISYP
jgi:hypothetical protein